MDQISHTIRALCLLGIFSLTTSVHSLAADAPSSQPDPTTINALMGPYIQIHDALAKDSMDGIKSSAQAISAASKDKPGLAEIAKEADALSTTKDLVSTRAAFVALSKSLIVLLKTDHVTTYKQAYCPMVRESWLQTGDTVSNPFSADMGTCGEIVELGSHLDKSK